MDWKDTTVNNDTDTEWYQYFQNGLESDSKLDYNQNNHRWNKCSGDGIDFEITDNEKQRYISFLIKIPQLYDKLKHWPTTEQKILLLAVARIMSYNEQTFIKINTNDTYNSLVKMTETTTSTLVKVRYMDMLCSFVEHDAGLKWTLETQYWKNIWNLVLQCQDDNCDDINQKIYHILSKFLQNTSKCAPKICQHVVKQMIQPIICSADKHYPKTKKQPIELVNPEEYQNFPPTVKCLIEILERLWANNETTSDALKYFLTLRDSCETLTLLSNNGESSLQLNRILTILCFYEMIELFDGIKVVNQDPLVLSGFFKIFEREMKKGNFDGMWKLLYYGQKYCHHISKKVPQYFQKGKSIGIGDELTSFQIEPVVVLGEKLSVIPFPQVTECDELLRDALIGDLLSSVSESCVQLGYEVREQYVRAPMGSELTALKCIIKTKPYYSRECRAKVFQGLIFSFKDFITYIKRDVELKDTEHNQLIAEAMLEAIFVFLNDFDLSWRESLGSLEVYMLNYQFFSCSMNWNSNVVILGLKILNITTLKNLTDNMILLVDYSNEHDEMGIMLMDKCASSNVGVRKAAMAVICTICQKINEGFESYKQILLHYLTPEVILTKAINDSNHSIRAIALSCLQEIIMMEEFEGYLSSTIFIDKILDIIAKEFDQMILKVSVKLIRQICENDKNETIDNLLKIYKVMSRVAIQERNADVQEEAVKFWKFVTKRNLELQGMIDDVFPNITFSKEHKKIIRLDDKEICKRIIRALDNMSKTGCLYVYQQVLENSETPTQVFSTTLEIITKLWKLLRRYDVTPELISINGTYPQQWSIDSGILSPTTNWVDNDEDMRELIEEMINEDITEISCPDVLSLDSGLNVTGPLFSPLNDTEDRIVQVSSLDFMEFIFRKFPNLCKC
ncbi:unnamed protein product [Ceutorhynchus assimilis]|uniref:Uncharacterized protein n=1 Tax=Ceutorhynchus assimilis TaxID=467358 RepID=A0A9P0GPV4_9CUCU|nr:unnamed protein product [Ceutorhynchus assimilis]